MWASTETSANRVEVLHRGRLGGRADVEVPQDKERARAGERDECQHHDRYADEAGFHPGAHAWTIRLRTFYPCRSTSVGLIREALRAGHQLAMAATATSTATAPASVNGSRGSRP